MNYQTNWVPNRNRKLRRSELQITTKSGKVVATVKHTREIAAAVATYEATWEVLQ